MASGGKSYHQYAISDSEFFLLRIFSVCSDLWQFPSYMEAAVKKNLADSYIFSMAVRLSGIGIGLALLSVHLPDHGIALIGKEKL